MAARRPVVASLALMVLTAACTGGARPGPGPAPSHLPFAPGGTLRIPVWGWVDEEYFATTSDGKADYALDPQFESFGPAWELLRCCLTRTLMAYNGTSTAEGGAIPKPDLAAAEPSVSPDGLTWTFRIRQGIHYAPPLQRTQVTAQDFVRGLERGLSPSLMPDPGSPGGYLPINVNFDHLYWIIQGARDFEDGKTDTISGVEAPNPSTLVLHLTQPSGDLPYRFAMPETAPIPPDPGDPSAPFGVATDHPGGWGRFLVGTGPYMIQGSPALDFMRPPEEQRPVSGYVPDISMTLVRNPSWERASDPLRPAYPDRIELLFFTYGDDAHNREAEELRAGRTDLAGFTEGTIQTATGDLTQTYLSDSSLRPRLHIYPADAQSWLAMNMAMPPFDDVHVRRAVNWAFDKRAFQQSVDGGHVESDPATHVALDSLEDNLLVGYDPYRTQDARGDEGKAKAEMALSAYDRDHDGVCDAAACRVVRIYLDPEDPGTNALVGILRRTLGPIGLKIKPGLHHGDLLAPHLYDPAKFGALTLDLGGLTDFPNGSSFFETFTDQPGPDHSLIGASPGELHRWGYRVSQVPSVKDRYQRCATQVGLTQARCWAELDQYLTEDVVPWVPVTVHNRQRIVSSRVVGFSYDQFTTLPALDRLALKPGTNPKPYPTTGGPVPAIPDGTYRFTITARDFDRFGVHFGNPDDLTDHTGTTTMTLRHGEWTSLITSDHRHFAPVNEGTYRGTGHQLAWALVRPFFNEMTLPPMTWTFDGHALHFRFVNCGDLNSPENPNACHVFRVPFEAHPWVKVG